MSFFLLKSTIFRTHKFICIVLHALLHVSNTNTSLALNHHYNVQLKITVFFVQSPFFKERLCCPLQNAHCRNALLTLHPETWQSILCDVISLHIVHTKLRGVAVY